MLIYDVMDALELLYESDIPAMLWASSGIGKTEIVKEFCEKKGLNNVTLHAAQCDGAELQGLPYIDNDKKITQFAPLGFLPETGKFVLFLDECLSPDSYIITDNGRITISEIHKKIQKGEKIKVKSYDEKSKKFIMSNIIRSWNKGFKHVIKLQMNNRKKLICTKNHPILTDKGYVEASKLIKGNKIVSNIISDTRTGTPALNEDQLQLVFGSVLGDGCISGNINGSKLLSCVQGEKQKDYLEYKCSLLNAKSNKIEKNGYAQTPAYFFTSRAINEIYGMSKEDIVNLSIKNMDIRGLSIFFSDDGSYRSGNNNKEYGKFYECETASLHTEGFNEDVVDKIVTKISDMGYPCKKYECKKKNNNKKYFAIYIPKISFAKMSKDIAKFIHPSMRYKICKKDRNVEFVHFNNKFLDYGYFIFKEFGKLPKYYENGSNVYDIEVENTHNFVVASRKNDNGIVVHNCNRGQAPVLQALFQLINDRTIGRKKFDCWVVGACNPNVADFQVAELDTALLARFAHISVTTTSKVVGDYLAEKHGYECPYIAYYQQGQSHTCEEHAIPPIKLSTGRAKEWAVKLHKAQRKVNVKDGIYFEILSGILPADEATILQKYIVPISLNDIAEKGSVIYSKYKFKEEEIIATCFSMIEYCRNTIEEEARINLAEFLAWVVQKYRIKDIVFGCMTTLLNYALRLNFQQTKTQISASPDVLLAILKNPKKTPYYNMIKDSMVGSIYKVFSDNDLEKEILGMFEKIDVDQIIKDLEIREEEAA